jgi:hypothetical protein
MATRFSLVFCAVIVFTIAANSQTADPGMLLKLSRVDGEWWGENTGSQTITASVLRFGTNLPLRPYIDIGPDFGTVPILPHTKVKMAVKPVENLEVRAVILDDGSVIGSGFVVDGYDFVDNIFEMRRVYAKELQLWTTKLHQEGIEKFQADVAESSKSWEQPHDLASSAINHARSDVKAMLSWLQIGETDPVKQSDSMMARFDKRTGEAVRSAARRAQ